MGQSKNQPCARKYCGEPESSPRHSGPFNELHADALLHHRYRSDPFRALIDQWRDQAEHLSKTMRIARAAELRLCADELEKVLNNQEKA